MRTKTLLLTAALSASGVAGSAAADVFSANIVGYVTKDLTAGFNLITNPLEGPDMTIAELFPDLAFGSVIYKFNGTGFDSASKGPAGWTDPSITVAPGQGVFVNVAAATSVTFVGEVKTGDLSTGYGAGFSIISSQVPQEGLVTTDLELAAAFGDTIYRFVDGSYQSHAWGPGGWSGGEPTVGVGESFWINANAAGSWDREFTVDN